ncbi:hypothetical protein AK812_SmicGene15238 [Symbiodinium microadriaticum]|uniref:Uncharacterized protein n=1 Tax=Symbiodinium microadriaticum TaxID=2951 RepID=A0A1Q9E3K3_SYMMI|nr:hypothetical protein AK812_SmicGene15238 [Symbiodinium microadriaticum]
MCTSFPIILTPLLCVVLRSILKLGYQGKMASSLSWRGVEVERGPARHINACSQAERRALLQQHPDARKVAAVLLGSPPADFREWVKMRQRADIEAKKALGEELPDEVGFTGFDEVRYEWAGEAPQLVLWLSLRRSKSFEHSREISVPSARKA